MTSRRRNFRSTGASDRPITRTRLLAFLAFGACFLGAAVGGAEDTFVLQPDAFAHHFTRFNTMEDEPLTNFIPNTRSWSWFQQNAPLFECPDKEVDEIYYYRWWTFRKHIKQTPAGLVVTEFLTPMKHAGIYNTISCAFGHHLAEGRWLSDQRFLDDY